MSDEADEMVRNLEAMYRETGNPLYLWNAVAAIPRPDSVPEWIWVYLIIVACRLTVLSNDRKEPPPAKLRRLQSLLEFTRNDDSEPRDYGYAGFRSFRGANAFRDFIDNERNAVLASWYERALERGLIGKNLVADAMKELNCSKASVHRYIRNAKELWEAQRRNRQSA
jgi:hypothetical protein